MKGEPVSGPAPSAQPEGELRRELARLDPALRERLDRAGFDAARLLDLAGTLVLDPKESADARRDLRNRFQGDVRAPEPGDLSAAPARGSDEARRLAELGESAMKRGELAFAVLAGGMATRMGGVVKALVEAIPGHTFLELRLAENRAASERAGRPIPLWLMTSEATHEATERALEVYGAPAHARTFRQGIGLRLTERGALFRDAKGAPSTYAPGHGDLVDALRRSGLLRAFREAGGKYVWIANLDNLGATVDPALLGLFMESGADMMVEVCDKRPGDPGGIPVYAAGHLQILEELRLPKTFDATSVGVFNTNTFLVRADALETVDVAWHWFEVEKQVDGRRAIQFERLLQELTGALHAVYVRVPRAGASSRFLPVKDRDELARRREEIELVARDRRMIPP